MSRKNLPAHRRIGLKLWHKPTLYRQYMTTSGKKVTVVGTAKGIRVAETDDRGQYDDLNGYVVAERDLVAECPLSDVLASLLRGDKYASIPTRHHKLLGGLVSALVEQFGALYMRVNVPRKHIGQDQRDHTVVALMDESGSDKKSMTRGYAKKKVGQGYGTCPFCRTQLTAANATAEHIIPFSVCRNNSPANLAPTCKACNDERGVMDFYEFMAIKHAKELKKTYPGVKIKRLKIPV